MRSEISSTALARCSTITMGPVQRADGPQQLVRGMPGYPVGMVLIARLAVDTRKQGAGLGTRLLADALRMAVVAGEAVAARLVVVDALDDQAAGFYRRLPGGIGERWIACSTVEVDG